jgi:Tfp pilus assembly protein PilX
MKNIANQQGFLTIITVILIVVIGFIAIAIAYITSNSAFSTNNFQEANSALYLADSGLEQATRALLLPTVASRSTCAGLSLTNASLGDGTYKVTSTGPFHSPAPATTLNGALTSSATTIPVTSTTGYQSAGRIMIDSELINYTAVSAASFLNASRGVDNSTAVAHVTGAPVGQYQCSLISSGGAPTLTPATPTAPGGIRNLNENIQLQEAWAVGNTVSSKFTLARWNNPTEVVWNNASATGSFNLASVFMLSYADGWAVGASTTFLHWNGSSWVSVATGLSGTYTSVFCNASNDCHAVANTRQFGHWNGSSWTQLVATGSVANTNLTSVNCGSSNDCWAVGTNTGGGIFYHGSGSPVAWVGVTESGLSAYSYNKVFCNSSTDCWAVGASNIFARLSGSTWANATGALTSSIPTAQYNSIFCNASADCWAVGNVNASKDLLVHWDGTAWTRDPSNPAPAVNLTTVTCANTNDCWAAGAASGGQPIFVHWNGTSWVAFTTTGLPNTTINSLSIIAPSSQPWSIWSENFS